MISGVVNARCEAEVRLRLRGPGGMELHLDAIIDSGFTAALALPTSAIVALGLVRQSAGGATLADASLRQFDIYAANVEWNGQWRPVLVWAVGNEVLVGMRLLTGHELRIQVVPGGAVAITQLP
jgi:predicted aspartyl protease